MKANAILEHTHLYLHIPVHMRAHTLPHRPWQGPQCHQAFLFGTEATLCSQPPHKSHLLKVGGMSGHTLILFSTDLPPLQLLKLSWNLPPFFPMERENLISFSQIIKLYLKLFTKQVSYSGRKSTWGKGKNSPFFTIHRLMIYFTGDWGHRYDVLACLVELWVVHTTLLLIKEKNQRLTHIFA